MEMLIDGVKQVMVSEIEINSRFQALTNQRNDALNAVVMNQGESSIIQHKLTQALARIVELEAKVAELEKPATDTPPVGPADG